jgi:outer membrane protein TolC
MTMQRWIAWAILLLPSLAGAVTPSKPLTPSQAVELPVAVTPERMDYEACVQRGLQRNAAVRAAAMSLDLYEVRLREAKTAAYPKLQFTGFATTLPTSVPNTTGLNPFTDFDWSLDALRPYFYGELTIAQPLFTFGKLGALRKLAREGIEVAQATRKVAEDELRYQVARAYWGLVLVESMQEMLEDGKRILKEQRERLEKLQADRDDSFDPSDLARLETYGAEFEDKYRQAGRNRALAMGGLAQAFSDPDTQVTPADETLMPVPITILPSEAYEMLALANHPRLLAMRHGVAAKLQQVDLASANAWPELAFTARIAADWLKGRQPEDESFAKNPTNPTQSGAGIALRWNLDILRTLAQRDAALVEFRQLQAQEQAETLKLRLEVRDLVQQLRDAQAMVAVHEKAMKAARGWLVGETQAWEDGFGTFEDVLKATEAWYRRRMAWLQAGYDHNVLVAGLGRAVGQDIRKLERGTK